MKNLQSLRLLLADKDKEIEELKKELTEEKNAYNKMYNMYVEKENIINEFDKWLEEQLMYFNDNNGASGFSTNIEDLEIVKEKLQELKGSDKE